jgi:soluble lytic murein transglycosylase
VRQRPYLPLFIFSLIIESCSPQSVLDIPRDEAFSKIEVGDIQFIIDAETDRLKEIALLDPAAPFYAALLLEKHVPSSEGLEKHTTVLLQEALKSPLTKIAAANKLIPKNPDLYFKEFSKNPSIAKGSEWERAFELLLKIQNPEQKREDIRLSEDSLSFFFDEPWDKTQRWLFEKLPQPEDSGGKEDKSSTRGGNSSPAMTSEILELARGRSAAARSSYREALSFFRTVIEKGQPSAFFFSHPELLSDVGKAFQYTAAAQGITLFLAWEQDETNFYGIPVQDEQNCRYRLFYFAGRMARQLGKYKDSLSYFEKAISFAPDGDQRDACIWYLLDSAYNVNSQSVFSFVKKYASRWTAPAFFNDIFDKISFSICKDRQWGLLPGIFHAIYDYADSDTTAKYAYIIARALELGFLKRNADIESSAFYYKAAYSAIEKGQITLPALYYRRQAAERLGIPENFQTLLQKYPDVQKGTASAQEIEFLNGFFKFGCAEFAYPYIKESFEKLGFADIRLFEEKLNKAEQWRPLINLSILYREKKGFRLEKRDLELSYPRGFKTYIEDYASQAMIDPALLFALTRQESVFTANARSRSGAAGLTQLMENTAREMAGFLARGGGADYRQDGKLDLLNPEANIHLGALYYRHLLDRMNSQANAVLAYNCGMGRLRRWRTAAADLPDDLFLETVEYAETREYGRFVLGGQAMYQFLYY